MNQLILVGTVHRDPRGKHRLLKLLENIRPSAVSLEVSPASINIRHQHGRHWIETYKTRLRSLGAGSGRSPGSYLGGAPLRGVFEYLRLPYEYRAAMGYARQQGIPLFLLDDSQLAASFLNRVEQEILTETNLDLLAQADNGQTLSQEVTAEYIRAGKRLLNPESDQAAQINDPQSWFQRESSLAQKLRLLHQGLIRRSGQTLKGEELVAGLIISPEAVGHLPETITIPKPVVHLYIGGWEHLVEDLARKSFYSNLKDLQPKRQLCFSPAPAGQVLVG